MINDEAGPFVRLGVNKDDADDLIDRLIEAHREPQRHYHTMRHILDCHYAITSYAHHATSRQAADEIYVALWFHDSIYDVRSNDNEARSAEWLAQELAGEVDPDSIERMSNMIIATAGHEGDYDPDTQLMLDIDLGILGYQPDRFDEYDRQIRKEYEWVPLEDYNFLRAKVLQGFLDRDQIYHTEPFRFKERQARENLTRKIAELTK